MRQHPAMARERAAGGCTLLGGAALAGLALAVAFQAFPEIDLAVSAYLKDLCAGDSRHGGWCHENGVLSLPRWFAMGFSAIVAAIAGLLALIGPRSVGELGRRRSLVMLATFALGPGLLANVILKDNWGRARPREVVELGGTRQFSAPLVPSRACHDNCSFVSGEAAGVFAPFFAASLVSSRFSLVLVAGGVAAGSIAGLVRMSTGGHFLSDVLFAGVFMAIVAVLAHWLVFGLGAGRKAMSTAIGRREVPGNTNLQPNVR